MVAELEYVVLSSVAATRIFQATSELDFARISFLSIPMIFRLYPCPGPAGLSGIGITWELCKETERVSGWRLY